jgi:hypothetical protein
MQEQKARLQKLIDEKKNPEQAAALLEVNEIPVMEEIFESSMTEFAELADLHQIVDTPLEFLVETKPDAVESLLNDYFGYSTKKLASNCPITQLDKLPFPFTQKTKVGKMRELTNFLEAHPGFKTNNVQLLQQRLFNHFVLKIHAADDVPKHYLSIKSLIRRRITGEASEENQAALDSE